MPFVKKVKPAESTTLAELSSTVATNPARGVKHFQREYGQTRKRVEDFSRELDAARIDFGRISAESMNDETLDAVAVSHAMTQAEQKIRALEGA